MVTSLIVLPFTSFTVAQVIGFATSLEITGLKTIRNKTGLSI